MGPPILSSHLLALTWPYPERYKWMALLPRRAWAWELMRRNPDYRAAFRGRHTGQQPVSELWPLLAFEDPDTDARSANVFWRRDACAEVLPVVALAEGCESDAGHFLTENLSCRIRVHEEPERDRLHLLFSEGSRALQLEVDGASRLPQAVLATPVLPPPNLRGARLDAVRRLNDLMRHGTLRPVHYPREPRGLRLARVIQAFDGAEAGAPQREIAVALFGRARVERDWHASHNPLRDHVRRAIARGRQLTQDGYRLFLA